MRVLIKAPSTGMTNARTVLFAAVKPCGAFVATITHP